MTGPAVLSRWSAFFVKAPLFIRKLVRFSLVSLVSSLLAVVAASPKTAPQSREQLKFVVVLTRHGVRSPTGNPDQYYTYSRAPWPQWYVPPGYLTSHGFENMRLFGAYDRMLFAREGLLQAAGCGDAARVTFYTDSDQRTRETGKALAEGMFPGCSAPVGSLPEGTHDPLFHAARAEPAAEAVAPAAQAAKLAQSLRPQLAELDHILATCGPQSPAGHTRLSIFDIPQGGAEAHSGEVHGPLNAAATLTENFLLEFTQGMPSQDVAWGCVDGSGLRRLIGLHTAAFNLRHRAPGTAGAQAANLLDRIRTAMAQAVAQDAGQQSAAALFLVGHDTNLVNVAGALGLNWFADGRSDDTPPGSALVFELWHNRSTGADSVRLWYTTQTLEQTRNVAPLTLQDPPVRIPILLTGCTIDGKGCTWNSFAQLLIQARHPDDSAVRTAKKQRHGE